jgi:hypothetical protein
VYRHVYQVYFVRENGKNTLGKNTTLGISHNTLGKEKVFGNQS